MLKCSMFSEMFTCDSCWCTALSCLHFKDFEEEQSSLLQKRVDFNWVHFLPPLVEECRNW